MAVKVFVKTAFYENGHFFEETPKIKLQTSYFVQYKNL
jgi:hypothetical protein